jgi:DNA-binding transcriptional ArsR family regulator
MSTARASATIRVRDAAPLFAALGDETRLSLVLRLSAEGPGSIARLSAEADVSRQAIKKHLDVLSEVGLVRGTRSGREHVWALQPRRLADAGVHLEKIARQWDDALGRLKAYVEKQELGVRS